MAKRPLVSELKAGQVPVSNINDGFGECLSSSIKIFVVA